MRLGALFCPDALITQTLIQTETLKREKAAIHFEDVVIWFLSRKAEPNLFRLNLSFGFSTSERPFPPLWFYTNTRKGALRAVNKYFWSRLSGGHWVYPWNNRPWNNSKIPLSFDALLTLHFSYSLQSTRWSVLCLLVDVSCSFLMLNTKPLSCWSLWHQNTKVSAWLQCFSTSRTFFLELEGTNALAQLIRSHFVDTCY